MLAGNFQMPYILQLQEAHLKPTHHIDLVIIAASEGLTVEMGGY